MRDRELSAEEEIASLRRQVEDLESQLRASAERKRATLSALANSSNWLVSKFFGSHLVSSGEALSKELEQWQSGKRPQPPLAEGVDVTVALASRFVRVGLAGLLFALVPTLLIVIQTVLLNNQNQKLDSQNELLGRDVALAAFEQTSRFRDILSLQARSKPVAPKELDIGRLRAEFLSSPRVSNGVEWDHPDPYEEGARTKWTQPRLSAVIQIASLADSEPELVIRSLVPLLSDPDGVVAAGALSTICEVLRLHEDGVERLQALLPKGYEMPVLLQDTHISGADFSVLSNTDLLWNARFDRSVIENADFSGVMLKGSNFSEATVLHSKFDEASLQASRWDYARVRGTSFVGSDLSSIYGEDADFGVQALRMDTAFAPVSFEKTNLNSAVLNRASFAEARFSDPDLQAMQVSEADFSGASIDSEYVTAELLEAAGVLFFERARYGR